MLTIDEHNGNGYSVLTDYTGGNPFDPELGYLDLKQSGEDTLLNVDFDGVGGQYSFVTLVRLVGVNVSDIQPGSFIPELELTVSGGTS